MLRSLAADPENDFLLALYEKSPKIENSRQEIYWIAFQELGTERQNGMSIGPIPVTKIWDWAEFRAFNLSETKALHYVIRQMDNEYMSLMSAKQNRASKKK